MSPHPPAQAQGSASTAQGGHRTPGPPPRRRFVQLFQLPRTFDEGCLQVQTVFQPKPGANRSIWSCQPNPWDPRALAVGKSYGIQLVDLPTLQPRRHLSSGRSDVLTIAWVGPHVLFSGTRAGCIDRYDTRQGQAHGVARHSVAVTHVRAVEGVHVLSRSAHGELRLWDTRWQGRVLAEYSRADERVFAPACGFAVCPAGRTVLADVPFLATGCRRHRVSAWDLRSARLRCRMGDFGAQVHALEFCTPGPGNAPALLACTAEALAYAAV